MLKYMLFRLSSLKPLPLAFASLAAVACGGGSESAPTLAEVSPARGPLGGGTAITVTGSGFKAEGASGLQLLIGGRYATDVTVVDDHTITAKSPEGQIDGAVMVTLFNGNGGAWLPDSFAYNPLPGVAQIIPNAIDPAGELITLKGSGFADFEAGTNTVKLGAQDCADLTVIDDATMTCLAPANPEGMRADATMANANGEVEIMNAVVWLDHLYVADGRQGLAGRLYRVNAATAEAFPVGNLSAGLTGMAFAPDGSLYGTESSRGAKGHLVMINPMTAALSRVGETTGHSTLPDITFVGSELYAWTENGDQLAKIDRNTAQVTALGNGTGSSGSGLTTDSLGTILAAPQGTGGPLYSVNPTTGVVTATVTLTSEDIGGSISSLAFHKGTLYGVVKTDPPTLVSIDRTTGALTNIGALPQNVDAMASQTP
jgi:hypothetical protein